jgi:hypothetical protein
MKRCICGHEGKRSVFGARPTTAEVTLYHCTDSRVFGGKCERVALSEDVWNA